MNQFNRSDAIAVRPRAGMLARAAIVLALALAMAMTSVAAPARAGATGTEDLETVRATVADTYTYKIGLLTDLRAGTDNPDKIAIYTTGIDMLAGILDTQVATETSVDALWSLKSKAYAIYEKTVKDAKNAGMTPEEILAAAKAKVLAKIDYKIKLIEEWGAECDLAEVRSIVADATGRLAALRPEVEAASTPDAAWAIKDRVYEIYGATKTKIDKAKAAAGEDCSKDDGKKDEKSKEELAAEKLAKARRSTLTLIARKTAILDAAAEAAKLPAVVEIFENAAAAVADLEDDARSARTTRELAEIRDQVMEIYGEAKDAVSALRTGKTEDDGEASDDMDDAGDTIVGHLAEIEAYVVNIVARAEGTAQESPETYADLLAAKKSVLRAIDSVQSVVDSGKDLDDRWEALRDALRDFRRAVIRHYIATNDGPAFVGGFHIAG